jgi:hypothetical protein
MESKKLITIILILITTGLKAQDSTLYQYFPKPDPMEIQEGMNYYRIVINSNTRVYSNGNVKESKGMVAYIPAYQDTVIVIDTVEALRSLWSTRKYYCGTAIKFMGGDIERVRTVRRLDAVINEILKY